MSVHIEAQPPAGPASASVSGTVVTPSSPGPSPSSHSLSSASTIAPSSLPPNQITRDAVRRSKSVSFAPHPFISASPRFRPEDSMSSVLAAATPSFSTNTASIASAMRLANHGRASFSSPNAQNARRAQLALLAEQASLASAGTSNLKVARAASLVMDEAVKRAMLLATASAKPEAQSDQSQSAGSTHTNPLTSASAKVDSEWEQATSSSEFLSSASSLANLFQAQEQNRRTWAGKALALQRRRSTMTTTRPTLVANGKRRADSPVETQMPESAVGDTSDESEDEGAAPSDQVAAGKKRKLAEDHTPHKSSQKDSRQASPTAISPTEDGVDRPAIESIVARRDSASAPPVAAAETRPQLLVNVLASFETLLGTRQKACAGLAELAKSADQMETFKNGAGLSVHSSRASSPQPRQTVQPIQACRNGGDSGEVSVTEHLDDSASLYSDGGSTVGEAEAAQAAMVAAGSLNEGAET